MLFPLIIVDFLSAKKMCQKPTSAVNLADIPLKTSSSPIFLRNCGASLLSFSTKSTTSKLQDVSASPSLLVATHLYSPASESHRRRIVSVRVLPLVLILNLEDRGRRNPVG